MLDKSVPYAGLYMCRRAATPIPHFSLPQGFRYAMYRSGDEKDWARIEASVAEFDSEFPALMHFTEKFMPYKEELFRRLLFIETEEGYKVATANAWWSMIKGSQPDRRAWLHWVAVDPQYQGLGLGKAVVSHALEIMREIEGDVDMYLSTQTWSYKAIDIYKKCGFEPSDEKALYRNGGKRRSEYKKALKILSKLNAKGLRQL